MKKQIRFLIFVSLTFFLGLNSCTKTDVDKTDSIESDLKAIDANFGFNGNVKLEKQVVKPLVKLDDCKYIVEGTINYLENCILVATIDFGNGNCDNIATKTIDGQTIEFNLDIVDKNGKDSYYKKVIVEPLVKSENCDFIVSGIVKFYKGDAWVATIDYGDGTCDQWATKTWEGGSKDFSLIK
ncbi:MAG: hypothetical protein Q8T08_22480 [Ignavibacteria bacterium]|nr:hypothetical protein [Ignavibacteria bacterium]